PADSPFAMHRTPGATSLLAHTQGLDSGAAGYHRGQHRYLGSGDVALRRHQHRRDDVRTLRGCRSQGVATGGQVVVVDYTGREADMNQLEERIASGTLVINGDGQMLSQKPDETWATIGHVGNRYGNIVVKYRDD